MKLFLPKYTEEQCLDVSETVLPKTSPSIDRYIGEQIWKNGGDIRDVVSIDRLVKKNDGHEEIAQILTTISKYGHGGTS